MREKDGEIQALEQWKETQGYPDIAPDDMANEWHGLGKCVAFYMSQRDMKDLEEKFSSDRKATLTACRRPTWRRVDELKDRAKSRRRSAAASGRPP